MLKPTNKNLAKYTGKGATTIARWKVNNRVLYNLIKKEFIEEERRKDEFRKRNEKSKSDD